MKKNSIRKLTIAGVLVAVAVVGSLFSIPVLGAKCSPVQHMVNVLGAVLLGPWYGVAVAFGAVYYSIFKAQSDAKGSCLGIYQTI